jgi:signal peptidase II
MKKLTMTHYGALALIILIADRLSKSWALNLTYEKIVNPFLSFALVFNRGINWGFFNAGNTALFIAINTAIAAVILGMFAYTVYCWRNHQLIIGQVLILAGALSNYFDRIVYGGVIDFIVLSIGNWSWPAFNIADSAILLGVAVVALSNYKNW